MFSAVNRARYYPSASLLDSSIRIIYILLATIGVVIVRHVCSDGPPLILSTVSISHGKQQ